MSPLSLSRLRIEEDKLERLSFADLQKTLTMFSENTVKRSWEEYLHRFTRLCRTNSLPTHRWAALLYSRLDGTALRTVESDVPDDRLGDFDSLKEALNREFIKERKREEAEIHLEHRTQKDGENVEEYGKELTKLALKAYPNSPDEQAKEVIRRLRRGLAESRLRARLVDFIGNKPRATVSEIIDHLAIEDPLMAPMADQKDTATNPSSAFHAHTGCVCHYCYNRHASSSVDEGSSDATAETDDSELMAWIAKKNQKSKKSNKGKQVSTEAPKSKVDNGSTKTGPEPNASAFDSALRKFQSLFDQQKKQIAENTTLIKQLQEQIAGKGLPTSNSGSATPQTTQRSGFGGSNNAPNQWRSAKGGNNNWNQGRRGPKSTDTCHKCGGKGHWARGCAKHGTYMLCEHCGPGQDCLFCPGEGDCSLDSNVSQGN